METQGTEPSAAVDVLEGASTAVVIGGTLVNGDTWRFTVAGHSYDYVIGTHANSLSGLATALANSVNNDSALSAYLAVALGDTVVIIHRPAPPAPGQEPVRVRPTVTMQVTLAGGAAGSSIGVVEGLSNARSLFLTGNPIALERWVIIAPRRHQVWLYRRRERHPGNHRGRPGPGHQYQCPCAIHCHGGRCHADRDRHHGR